MSITMPKLDIIFKQLATSLPERSERGIAALIMRDDTSAVFNYKMYKDITEVEADNSLYTPTNYQYIKDAFEFGTYEVAVVKIGTDSEANVISTAFTILQKQLPSAWITICDGKADEYSILTSWIKSQENNKKTYKAAVYKVNTTDCKHVVNFFNEKVTFADERGEVPGEEYLPSLVGIFASCNVTKGCTYFKCTNLISVAGVDDIDAELEAGHFVLFNDTNYVRIAQGVNSMTTTDGENNTEDMRYIETVEAMDMIMDDISSVFKNQYLGNYKNKLNNQMLLISAINGYFDGLVETDVLDEEHANIASVDVNAQRKAWTSSGKVEAASWDDAKVRRNTFKRDVFLAGDIKILGSMTNLKFNISLF